MLFQVLYRILWLGVSWYFTADKCTLAGFGKNCGKNFVPMWQFKELLSNWKCPKTLTWYIVNSRDFYYKSLEFNEI